MNFERLEQHHLYRDGLRLSYLDERGDGLPVVLQHGLCGSARQTAEAFPEAGDLRLLTLECRGHGGSDVGAPEGISIASFAEDLVDLIETEGLGPTVVGGISMGAAVALRVAVLRPDLVRALILARPAWVLDAAPPNMAPNGEVGRLIRELGPEEGREAFQRSSTAQRLAIEAPDNLTSLLSFFDREPRFITAQLLERISVDGPRVSAEQVRKIEVPTLVIGHELDSIHPLGHARALAALLPRAYLAEITPKSVNRQAYVAGMQSTLEQFLRRTSS